MLQRVKLTNFQRHRALEITFNAGFSAIRGANEAGKSTMLRAVCYALFGVKALPDSLDAVVTWGEPVNSLKVELDLVIDGVQYNVKRGKSGCECNYDGGRVTGQTEVTNFLCGLMKVDPAAATKLMLSNQMEIRGALEAGAKATTELIERLADFDQIDNLIELIQERLPLGSSVTAEAALAGLEERLEAARAGAVQPDMALLQADLTQAGVRVDAAQAAVDAFGDKLQKAQEVLDAARATQAARERLQDRLRTAQAAADAFNAELARAGVDANTINVFPRLRSDVEKSIEQLSKSAQVLAQFNKVQSLLNRPTAEHTFDGTIDELEQKISALNDERQAAQARITVLERDIAVSQAGLTSGSCGFCGQDFSHLPAVAEKNAAITEKVAAATAEVAELKEQVETLKSLRSMFQSIWEDSLQVKSVLPEFVERVGATLPPTYRWSGPNIDSLTGADKALAAERALLAEMDAEDRRQALANAKLADLNSKRDAVYGAVGDARFALDEAPTADVPAAQAAVEALRDERRPLQEALDAAKGAVRDAEYRIRDVQRAYEQALAQLAQLEADVTRRREEIKTLAFNNALLKRVRQARPVIADKLWAIVLSAVSSYFSEMRGVRSSVTKDGDGFKVDGHPISTLSGSTLDILGLAIRVALVRTFLPNAPFLVLDEPSSACDQQRTEAMLGFLVSCGFRQVLLVTHEDTSESVADHMIQL